MKWIKCKDRLPDEDCKVLVHETIIAITPWYIQRTKSSGEEFWHNGDKMFCLYNGGFTRRRWFIIQEKCRRVITHWMKFPDDPE